MSSVNLPDATFETVQALACPKLWAAIQQAFAGQSYTPAGNSLNGCSSIIIADGRVIYTAALVTDGAGNTAGVASFKAAQAGTGPFAVTAGLLCFSTTVIRNTNTGIQRAQLTSFNTLYVNPGQGCSSSFA